MSEAERQRLRNAGDSEIPAIKLQALIDLEFDLSLTGFSVAEIDLMLAQAREASTNEIPPAAGTVGRSSRAPNQSPSPTAPFHCMVKLAFSLKTTVTQHPRRTFHKCSPRPEATGTESDQR